MAAVACAPLGGWTTHPVWLALTAAVTLVGVWASSVADVHFGKHDDGRIVIDEIAGYLVTIAYVPSGWQTALAGFVAFRWFDITKPPPIGGLDARVNGGWGVMVDDLVAGVYANLVLQLLTRVLGLW